MTPKVFNINRRRFIKSTFAITAATGVPGWFLELEQAHAAQPKPLGPNDRPGIALVGCGGPGPGRRVRRADHGPGPCVCGHCVDPSPRGREPRVTAVESARDI